MTTAGEEKEEQPNKAFQKRYWSEDDEADDDFFPEEPGDRPEITIIVPSLS